MPLCMVSEVVETRSTPKSARIAGFDGLRAIAVIWVFMFHRSGVGMNLGAIGVQVFFVLSGFLIIGGIMRATQEPAGVALRRFFINRSFRILPIYILNMAAVVAIAAAMTAAPWDELWRAITFTYNFYLYHAAQHALRLSYTWSLSIEEQFYVFAAPAMLLAGRKRIGPLCWILMAVATARAAYLIASHASWFDQYADSIINFGTIAFGGLLSQVATRKRLWITDTHALALLCLMVTCPLIIDQLPDDHLGNNHLVEVWATAIIAGALLVAVAQRQSSLAVRMLEFAPLAALGRISYGFYLYHALLTDEVVNSLSFGWIDVRRMPQFESMSVLFVISAGVSAASWALIEKPAMRLRSRLIGPASQPFTRSLPTAAKRRYDRVAKISM